MPAQKPPPLRFSNESLPPLNVSEESERPRKRRAAPPPPAALSAAPRTRRSAPPPLGFSDGRAPTSSRQLQLASGAVQRAHPRRRAISSNRVALGVGTQRRGGHLRIALPVALTLVAAGTAYAVLIGPTSQSGSAQVRGGAVTRGGRQAAERGGPLAVRDPGAHATNPFNAPAMRAFLASRTDHIGAAVENLRTGQVFEYHPGRREQTASIMKVDILEARLHEDQDADDVVSPTDNELAEGMIENSDNDDAQALWDEDGGSSAVAAYNATAGMKDTSPNPDGYWGLTWTTAPDQIALLRQLIVHDGLLTRTSQDYQLGLMSEVEADQRWGVSGGVPAGAQIALKNGWLPLAGDDWQVNSIGRINGDGRHYLIAVLTDDDNTEAYGIDTIEQISTMIWQYLDPDPAPATPRMPVPA